MRIGLFAAAALLLSMQTASAQRVDEHPPSQNQTTTNPQPVPMPDDVKVPEGAPTGATDTTQPNKGNKVTRQLKKALPDCINIIFHSCPGNSVRDQEQQEKEEAQRARAAQRCEALKAAHPPVAPATPADVPAGESSSKSSMPADLNGFQCTPEDVIAAEHDVDVGDFNFNDKNYRGAEMRYRGALERLPGDPLATLHLARVLEKQGKKAEALQLYQEFMKWSPTGKDQQEATGAIARLSK